MLLFYYYLVTIVKIILRNDMFSLKISAEIFRLLTLKITIPYLHRFWLVSSQKRTFKFWLITLIDKHNAVILYIIIYWYILHNVDMFWSHQMITETPAVKSIYIMRMLISDKKYFFELILNSQIYIFIYLGLNYRNDIVNKCYHLYSDIWRYIFIPSPWISMRWLHLRFHGRLKD